MAKSSESLGSRLGFMLAVVPYVQLRGGATIAELAARFHMTESEVKTAVSTIALSGIPGESGTYQHNDLFDIDWDAFENGEVVFTNVIAIDRVPRFSRVELGAIVSGLSLLAAALDGAEAAAVRRVLAKLHVSDSTLSDDGLRTELSVLRNGIESRTAVEFDYVDSHGARSHRLVDPISLTRGDAWYALAWCHDAKVERTFRVDRMHDMTSTSVPFLQRDAVTIPDAEREETAILRLAPEAIRMLSWFPDAEVSLEPNRVAAIARVRYGNRDALIRSIMALPGRAEALEDAALRRAVRDRAACALSQYVSDTSGR